MLKGRFYKKQKLSNKLSHLYKRNITTFPGKMKHKQLPVLLYHSLEFSLPARHLSQ